MKSQTLAGFERYGKTTKRAAFLSQMDKAVPWSELCGLIEPVYPKAGTQGGRPPAGLEKMLRIHFLQAWFNLSDPGVEEALYDSATMRSFAGIDLGVEPVPDETTVLNFPHLLEQHKLGDSIPKAVNQHLKRNGIKVTTGTIVDATIISAPSSTKNQDQERDPQMHQTAKGKQWYFGMKASKAKDFTNQRYRFGKRIDEEEKARNRTKSRVRSKVEHAFWIIKGIFKFTKVRYRGLAKNLHRLQVTCALANLYMVRRRLLWALR